MNQQNKLLADQITEYLYDAPGNGGHSDNAGANAYELLADAVAALRAAGSAEPERCPTCRQTNAYYWHAAPLRLCSDSYHTRPALAESSEPYDPSKHCSLDACRQEGCTRLSHMCLSRHPTAPAESVRKVLQAIVSAWDKFDTEEVGLHEAVEPAIEAGRALLAALSPTPLPQAAEKAAETVVPFQQRVQGWMKQCFSMEICRDRQERNHRFLEEALELVQACGCTASEAHQLVDYVYGRDQGEINQEVGGVMVTLAALCLANDIDMHEGGEVELARILKPETMAKIRAKQAAKPKHSPLPQAAAEPTREEIANKRPIYVSGLARGLASDALDDICDEHPEAKAYTLARWFDAILSLTKPRGRTREA